MKKSDCEILLAKADSTLSEFDNCLESIIDDKKTKLNVVGSFFKFGFSLTKLTLSASTCAIKNTPKAIVTIAAVKKELIAEIQNEWSQYNKEQKERALEEKISELLCKEHRCDI